ncbi:MAG: hypothetical protein QW767_04575 [Thermoprotei archaeon]
MRIADIVHFTPDKKPSSTLVVDDIQPKLDERGYVSKGGFYLSIKDGSGGKIVIKLTDTEGLDLSKRLEVAYQNHVLLEMQLQASKQQG